MRCYKCNKKIDSCVMVGDKEICLECIKKINITNKNNSISYPLNKWVTKGLIK